jgi:bacterioferritin (cytochrome b1)
MAGPYGSQPSVRVRRKEAIMPAGQTGFDDVTYDLISVQYHSLKAGHDYGQYVRDARNAGQEEIAAFFEEVMAQDADRAKKCHEFLRQLGGIDNTSPQ